MLKTLTVDSRIKGEIDEPIIVRVNKFNERAVAKFSHQMIQAHCTGQNIIPIVIDSYGGSVYSLMAMISEIQSAKLPVATVVESKAMSCGAILFSFGTPGYRYVSPHASLMIHDISAHQSGKLQDLQADTKELERLNQAVFKMMAKNCDRKQSYFLDLLHKKGHSEWFLSAKEAKKHGLANHIKSPTYHVKIEVNMIFG